MIVQREYSVEKMSGGQTFEGSGGKAAVQAMLNGKAIEGWEFIESHGAPDNDGRYYVFVRALPSIPGAL